MHYYHLKLDLFVDNNSTDSSNGRYDDNKNYVSSTPPKKSPQQHRAPSPVIYDTTQVPIQAPFSIAAQTTRFQNLFKPFPQRPSIQHPSEVSNLGSSQSAPFSSTTTSTNTDLSQTLPPWLSSKQPWDYRFGPIRVSTLDSASPSSTKDKSASSKQRTHKNKKMATAVMAASSASSNAAGAAGGTGGFQETEPAQGILRLYKDTNEITTGECHIPSGAETEEFSSSAIPTSTNLASTKVATTTADREREGALVIHPDQGTSVCVLAVPSYVSPGDFLNFVGPVRANVSHFRIIRDSAPNRFMVLMKFRTSESTAEFYRRYNGKAFSSLEPEICHVVYLKSIEIRAGSMPPYAFPFLNDDPFLQNHHSSAAASTTLSPTGLATTTSLSTSQNPTVTTDRIHRDPHIDALTHSLSTLSTADLAGLAELPTCPVCLERMDSSVTGLLTILCQHTFHCHCLSKWGEGSCPVCRYSQKTVRNATAHHSLHGTGTASTNGLTASTDGITEDQNVCALCGTSENLWICLICGHIGCGRYQEKHAYHHYYETSHLYALELETQRVWDYAGDGYVHRLIQNKADGKLVELPSAVDGTLPSQHSVQVGQEKLDAIGLEYTYLLTSQLESQRLYFDAQMAAMAAQLAEVNKEAKEWEKEAAMLNQKNRELALHAEALEKEKVPLLIKEKRAAEKRLEKVQERLQLLERQYEEEKEMNSGLRTNQESFKQRLQEKEADIQDLQDQVRDIMIYLDTQQKVEASPMKDELVNGTVAVATPPTPAGGSSSPLPNSSRRKGGRK
ncbi:hypothetical protein BGZ99_004002 [Dissophora globulifera]|uniref:Uncharacterized protein n=1 Tax=Dissophora globulifera TaxID=979702 RepID=A0A9P6RVT6_9FUNG|nr:hypothetical protein BGZ99_004002 [Dissophora globulifera]